MTASNFTAINTAASSTSTQTVSPKDLFTDSLASAPASTAFTNLTSPDIDQSPYNDSYNPSPAWGAEANGVTDADNWFPLFADSDGTGNADAMTRNFSQQSLGRTDSSSNSPMILNAPLRKTSSTEQSPLNRLSSVAGVKPRRRKGPLPTIVVDPNDKIATKRARNTLAARESRQRKLNHVQELEARLQEAEAEKELWKQAAVDRGAPSDLH